MQKAVRVESTAIVRLMLNTMIEGMPLRGADGSLLRGMVGDVEANAADYMVAGIIGTKLQACFDQAWTAGVGLVQLDNVREAMMSQAPIYASGSSMKVCGIVFSFVQQCNIISEMNFVSRIDVDTMIARMGTVIEEIKLEVSELLFGTSYSTIVGLSAALVQHLTAAEQMLPRIVTYAMPDSYPALYNANYLYGDGSRYDELIEENKTIHPAFMQREIIALSE